jgi:hypothetical protein
VVGTWRNHGRYTAKIRGDQGGREIPEDLRVPDECGVASSREPRFDV